jgi:hypothetical protein
MAAREEPSEVDVSHAESVERELDRLIEKRHDQRVQSEGERLEEELWRESERKHQAKRREENRIAWCAYYRGIAGALYARAEEYIVRAEKLENGHRKETA